MSKAQGERAEGGEDKSTMSGEKLERMDKAENADGSGSVEEPKRPAGGGGDLTIYLFGRTGREKEEWFRRFLFASRMKSEGRGGSLPCICKSGQFNTTRCVHSLALVLTLFTHICTHTYTHTNHRLQSE